MAPSSALSQVDTFPANLDPPVGFHLKGTMSMYYIDIETGDFEEEPRDVVDVEFVYLQDAYIAKFTTHLGSEVLVNLPEEGIRVFVDRDARGYKFNHGSNIGKIVSPATDVIPFNWYWPFYQYTQGHEEAYNTGWKTRVEESAGGTVIAWTGENGEHGVPEVKINFDSNGRYKTLERMVHWHTGSTSMRVYDQEPESWFTNEGHDWIPSSFKRIDHNQHNEPWCMYSYQFDELIPTEPDADYTQYLDGMIDASYLEVQEGEKYVPETNEIVNLKSGAILGAIAHTTSEFFHNWVFNLSFARIMMVLGGVLVVLTSLIVLKKKVTA